MKRVHFKDYEKILQSDMTPPISVIMPAHNEVGVICESVRSLLLLRYPEYEIIVVSDGSTDGTVEILEREIG